MPDGYEPKHFSCHYFEVMTLLDQVEEKGMIIALRSIMPKEKPFAYFQGGRLMQDRPHPDAMVLVVEGTLKGTPQEICDEVARSSIREVILADVAGAPPFHSESKLEDVKDEEAKRVIEKMRARGSIATFELVHTYPNTVKYEEK